MLSRERLFAVNTENGFMWGFPGVLMCCDRVQRLFYASKQDMMRFQLLTSFVFNFLHVFLVFGFHLLIWTVNESTVQLPQMHTNALFATPVKQISALMQEDKTETRDTKTERASRNKGKHLAEAKPPACCTPLWAAFLIAHLRKTSVPPHDAEPCVSSCL